MQICEKWQIKSTCQGNKSNTTGVYECGDKDIKGEIGLQNGLQAV